VQTADDTDALQRAPEWDMTGLAAFHTYDLQFFLAGSRHSGTRQMTNSLLQISSVTHSFLRRGHGE